LDKILVNFIPRIEKENLMPFMIFKLFLSATVIAFSSWLAGKRPELAGFIMALPVATLLALPFSYAQYHDPAASVKFAQGVFAAVPMSLLFFVPFLLASRLHWNFWWLYISGLVLLAGGYVAHRWVMSVI
jgi:hypothetical protein